MDAGHGLYVVYLDYRKAFDTIPHKRLLTKVSQTGVSGKVLHWTKAFLSERETKVTVNGSASVWYQSQVKWCPTRFSFGTTALPNLCQSLTRLDQD